MAAKDVQHFLVFNVAKTLAVINIA